jgi:nucleoside 2-deoxyribosyltransferase
MISAYIAGTLGGRDKAEVSKERAKAVKPLRDAGWDVYDPFEDEKSQVKRLIPDNHKLDTMRAFINKDLRKVRKCDVLIVLTGDNPTDGTWDEKCTAWSQGSVVVLVAPLRKAGQKVSFSNLRSHYLAESIEDAVAWSVANVYESEDGGLYLKGTVWP